MDGYITIGTKVDTTGVDSGINNITKSVNKGMSSLQNSVNKTFSFIKKSIIGAGIILALRAITKELGNAVSRLDTMKNFTNVMSNLGISGKDADASISRLSEKLKGLPTSLDDAALAVQRFASANNNVKASTEMYLALNNALLAGGASVQIQATAMEQLAQSYAKGKPDMMEWRTAMTAMPAQLQQVAKVMGYVNAEALGEALRDGSVSMNEFMFTLMKMNKEGLNGFKSLEEQARNSTGGIQTSIENVKNAITRGLANIMDAIGRSNIAGFFDGIRDAIDKVVPYIQAFVKLIVTAITYISALFGKKTKKQTDESTSSIDGFGSSVSQASENMDSASGSASKLRKQLKQLAGFDEMNVLQGQDQPSGGSGSGGAGGGSSVDLSDFEFDADFDKVASKMDEIYQKMLKWVKEFTKDMNFEPLVKSVQNLGDAMGTFLGGVGKLWGGFVDNFIKPLATYAVNDFLPGLFNASADFIRGINFDKLTEGFNAVWQQLEPIIEKVGNLLLWIYENILLPIGTWLINNILPIVLRIITSVLKLINMIADVLGPILLALWDNVIKPIGQFIGKVIETILTWIADALDWIVENIGPIVTWIKEKIIQPIVGFFKGMWEAIKIVFGPVIEFFKSIFTTVWENIKTVVDNIKQVFSVLWEGIKAIFGPVVQFFKDIFTKAWTTIKNVFSPFVQFFSGLWDKVKEKLKQFGAKIGEVISGAFKGVVNGVLGAIENILNFPIKSINKLIGVINKVPGINLSKLSTFSLPRLASGAIINQPGRGVPVGGGSAIAGEAGREGILPLTDSQAMQMLGKEIGRWVNINANIPVSIGNKQIARVVQQLMAERDFAMNS